MKKKQQQQQQKTNKQKRKTNLNRQIAEKLELDERKCVCV